MANRKHPNSNCRKARLEPPAHLNERAKKIFTETVDAVDPEHFTRVDYPLLGQFAVASALAEQAQANLDKDGPIVDGKASPWLVVQEKSVRALVALSARLRLCPQSRFDRTKAGTTSRDPSGGIPSWEFIDDDLLAK